MILILISIIFLTIINYGCGFLLKKFLAIETESFTLISLLGLTGITSLETIIAFFYPLNSYIEIIFITTGLFGFLAAFFKTRLLGKLFQRSCFWFYLYFLIIIFSASFAPYLYDHYSYYIPTISYLSEVGFVKGISNLDLLLGQASFWHIYQSGFSHFTDPFLRINSYLLFLFLIYAYEKKQWNLLLFLPFFLIFVQQPSPDLPMMILVLIVINELIAKNNNTVILCLSLLAVCIKPIVFWLSILVIFDLIKRRKFSWKLLIPVLVFGFLFVIKNLYLYGFPVFPMSFPDFGLIWKPHEKILTYSSQIGLMKSYDMHYSYQQILEFEFFDKIFNWFTIGYKSVFNFGILICIVFLGFFACRKKEKLYSILFGCILVKSILIFEFSAQYRFFLDVFIVTIFILFFEISKKRAVLFSVLFSILILTFFSFPTVIRSYFPQFNSGKYMQGFTLSQILKPKEIQQTTDSDQYQLGNLRFNVPAKSSYKAAFPSISRFDLKLYQYYGVFPQRFKNGFIQKNLSEKEKKDLANIISKIENPKP